MCDIYFKSCISQVKLYKIHGKYYVERGSAFSTLFFFFFFVFLDYIKYKYYWQQQFLQQKNKKKIKKN